MKPIRTLLLGAAGADFTLLGLARTRLRSRRPVVAVVASRTGAGKSQTSRAVIRILKARGLRVGVIRHPMPDGDLAAQRVQRFAAEQDLVHHELQVIGHPTLAEALETLVM